MYEFPETVASSDAIPEQFRSLYDKKGEQFVLKKEDPTIKGALEAMAGLTKSIKAARAEADAAKKGKIDLAALKDFGETPEAILTSFNAKLQGLQDELAKGSKAKIDLDSLRADLTKAHKTEIEKYVARNTGLQNQLFTLLVENNAKTAIVNLKGDMDLLMPFVKDRVRAVEEDGQIKVYVVGESGERRYGATGQDMTIAELVSEMKGSQRFAKLFESEAPRGGGAPPSGPTGRRAASNQADMTANQKIAAALSSQQRRN